MRGDPNPLLAISGLVFAWPGQTYPCLEIEAMELRPGESLFLHGPSGCGKSTLLSLMAGVLVANRGGITLAGTDWRSLRPGQRDRHRADHVGYIFQQFNLLPWLGAIDNVTLACRFSTRRLARTQAETGATGQAAAVMAAEQALAAMALAPDCWRTRAGRLSVGQQQRVAAARALIGSPDLIIADEPTSALDEALRDAFISELLTACSRAKSALVFVSHDQRLAAHFDRQISLPEINRAQGAQRAAAS